MNGALLADSVALFHELVEAAILAPSPDNNQPWRFHAHDGSIFLCADWARGLPSDVGNMFMYLSLGAAAENICIAASNYGNKATASLLSEPEMPQEFGCRGSFARIDFVGPSEPDGLAPFLAPRTTCRKHYSKQQVNERSLATLAGAAQQFDGVAVEWITDRSTIRHLAGVIARCDLVRLQYRPFHEELYKQLRFSQQEAERTRDGLDVRTLELPPGAGFMLRSLKPWRRMKTLHKTGLGRLLALPSAATVRASGALGILTMPVQSEEWSFVAGRALQRLWLAATAEQISLQPLGSLPIFLGHLEDQERGTLSPATYRELHSLRDQLRTLTHSVCHRALFMIVRIGYSNGPSCRSLRRAVEEFVVG